MFRSGRSYLYVEEAEEQGWAFRESVVQLQFLRQVVASLAGDRSWRWQSMYPQADVQSRYRRTLHRTLPVADEIWLESTRTRPEDS